MTPSLPMAGIWNSLAPNEAERGVEFLVVTRWSSMEAIREFAGTEAETAWSSLQAFEA